MNKKIITAKRLTLRPFNLNDVDAMFKNWASNPNVTKYLSWPTHNDKSITAMVVNNWIKEYEDGAFNWAIVLNEINEPIGNISVVNHDKETNTLELGYAIGEKFWNKGYTSEALVAVLKYFKSIGYKNIIAKHDINNPASGRVMEKAGMTFTCFQEKAAHNNQGLVDCNVYTYLDK